ncbi:unnamed protein product [Adineta steineri]|uniref:Helix-turn-helix domain-containing protein n=2 Tax=Adineta steineri TaxID=433720 RepID=A0A815F4Z1_9BILA|nr:unnamed protein product [Adineta steineri]
MHLSINQTNNIDRILFKQMAPLRRQLTKVFNKYPVDPSKKMKFEQEIEQLFQKFFSIPIPSIIEQRSIYEQQLLRSIKLKLKKEQLILQRTSDNNNTYYLGNQMEFNEKTNEYMNNANYFELVGIIDHNNTEQKYLNEIIESIELVSQELYQKKCINEKNLLKMLPNKQTIIHLPYLYFLPEIHSNYNMTVQARISSCNQYPVQALALFLYQLLRPLFESYSKSTTLNNNGDFIRKLEQYCIQSDCLLSHTKFITFEIHNLHKRVSHTDIIKALHQFLTSQQTNVLREQGLSNDTIKKLTLLFLQNNMFSYQEKIYRFVKGCSINFRLSRLLFNIYLNYWQLPLVQQIRLADEFYGRYYNMGIMTWYGSTNTIQTCFNELNYQHPDIQLTQSMGLNIHFLDVYIENRNGKLYTRVYHDPKKQLFLLPYVTGHPRLIHRQWFRYALIRAGQICCTLEDFQHERLYIELTFLANGYSLEFVEYQLEQFYKRFNGRDKQPSNLDRYSYGSVRRELFRCLDRQKHHSKEHEQLLKNRQYIEFYYLFDWGLRYKFNQNFRRLWFIIIEQDPEFKKYGFKIKLTTRHCYLTNSVLTHH